LEGRDNNMQHQQLGLQQLVMPQHAAAAAGDAAMQG
jgi:hypothetical protein